MISAPVRGQAPIQPQAGPPFDTPPWLGQPFPQNVSMTPIQEQQAMQAYVRMRMAQQSGLQSQNPGGVQMAGDVTPISPGGPPGSFGNVVRMLQGTANTDGVPYIWNQGNSVPETGPHLLPQVLRPSANDY